MSQPVYLIAASRTPVAPKGGILRDLAPHDLSAAPIRECLSMAGLPASDIDELILSNALGAGGNPARLAVLAAGLPQHVAGLSIDRQCVGGLDALLVGKAMIASGMAHCVLAGGAESASLRPDRYYRNTWQAEPQFRDQAPFTPWPERDPLMTEAAADLAEQGAISKQEQDQWAIQSHEKARAACKRLSEEISLPDGIKACAKTDPFTRHLTPRLCQRAPLQAGTISAANMAVAADGAAFVLLASQQIYDRLKPVYALRLADGQTSGSDPLLPGHAPIGPIGAILKRNALTPDDLDAVELMEAFAAQAIACAKGAGLKPQTINRSGGALARGHPIGASGAILAVRLFHELNAMSRDPANRTDCLKGLAAIAGAGGLGTSLLVETVAD